MSKEHFEQNLSEQDIIMKVRTALMKHLENRLYSFENENRLLKKINEELMRK